MRWCLPTLPEMKSSSSQQVKALCCIAMSRFTSGSGLTTGIKSSAGMRLSRGTRRSGLSKSLTARTTTICTRTRSNRCHSLPSTSTVTSESATSNYSQLKWTKSWSQSPLSRLNENLSPRLSPKAMQKTLWCSVWPICQSSRQSRYRRRALTMRTSICFTREI